jgi:hypothetical protein
MTSGSTRSATACAHVFHRLKSSAQVDVPGATVAMLLRNRSARSQLRASR